MNTCIIIPFVVVKVISISSAPETASVLSTFFNGSSLPVERQRRFRSDLATDAELLAELHVDDTDEDRTIVGPRSKKIGSLKIVLDIVLLKKHLVLSTQITL